MPKDTKLPTREEFELLTDDERNDLIEDAIAEQNALHQEVIERIVQLIDEKKMSVKQTFDMLDAFLLGIPCDKSTINKIKEEVVKAVVTKHNKK
jgi:hypothetical protein